MNETFWTLFCNRAHWEFEIFLMLLFDGLIGLLIWPFLKKHWEHHIMRDQKEELVLEVTGNCDHKDSKGRKTLYEHITAEGRRFVGCARCSGRRWDDEPKWNKKFGETTADPESNRLWTCVTKYQPAPTDRSCLLINDNELQFEGVLPNRIMWGGLGLTVYYNDGHQFTFNVADVPKVKK